MRQHPIWIPEVDANDMRGRVMIGTSASVRDSALSARILTALGMNSVTSSFTTDKH